MKIEFNSYKEFIEAICNSPVPDQALFITAIESLLIEQTDVAESTAQDISNCLIDSIKRLRKSK